jgi:hypothetical protein
VQVVEEEIDVLEVQEVLEELEEEPEVQEQVDLEILRQ